MPLKLTVAVFFLSATLVLATTAMAMNAPKPKPGVVTKKKMYEAALVLMDTMDAGGAMSDQMNASIDAQMQSMSDVPCADKVMPQMRNIMRDALNYNMLKGDLASVYANNFTLEELNWMVDFYKTPLGIKLLKTQPVIYETISNLSTARMKAAQPKISALFASNLNTQECQAKGR